MAQTLVITNLFTIWAERWAWCKDLTFPLVCWQLTSQTTWWAAMGRVVLNTTSWLRWRRRPRACWPVATTSSNPSSPTTTSTTTCPGSGTWTSRKTGKTKRGLCVWSWGCRGGRKGFPQPLPSSSIFLLILLPSLPRPPPFLPSLFLSCISCSHALSHASLS